nr:sorbosone dehydrogenase family protein [Brevundimonas diminuta]
MSPRRPPLLALPLVALLGLAACETESVLPETDGFGAAPNLPPPQPQAVPTVKIARAVGWPQGQTPVAAAGLAVNAFATGLDHPRWLYVLPNGDVLVAESQAPAKPKEKKGGLRGWIEGLVMARAGSGDRPSADRISLLRDADGDGTAETKTVFLSGLTSPFGMALVGERLYVANADAVVMVPYQTGRTRIDATPVKVADLPAGRNHHWTKSLVASADGTKLYVGVGSNSNIGENGLDEEVDRAAILEIDAATGARRVFASGLRNPVGLAWNPQDGRLWTSVNERDALGDDLVPDYMTSVKPGGFYGWPWSYYGQNVDERVQPARPDMVARAIKPDYALGSHTASLGLTFYTGGLLPQWRDGAIIGQHGSWNRNPPSGYKVIFVPFRDGRPDGPPQDVLTGFRNARGEAMGRPVGVAVDGRGALLVADDVGDAVWRVTPASR